MTDFSNSKRQKIEGFDPSEIGLLDSNIFGLPFTNEESDVVVIPMPWEVTVSYREGTARGPETMFNASFQVDLYDSKIPEAWKMGIGMEPISDYWLQKNAMLRPKAEACIHHLEQGGSPEDPEVKPLYEAINAAGRELNDWMYRESKRLLDAGKSVAVMGGEHSVPLGFMRALAERHPKFSMLHIDAHADLRQAYEGFEFSHASIQYNASKLPNIDQMVLVGTRDYSQQEADRIAQSKGRMLLFDDTTIKHRGYEGVLWKQMTEEILAPLSEFVYLSYDIDALDPALCPHTGTPVPGGLEFEQVLYLVEQLVRSGRKLIGFDLCEVAPTAEDDWDSVVGVRTLYRLANMMGVSQGKLKWVA